MKTQLEENQTVEMTVNLRRICAGTPWTKRAIKAVKKFRLEIQKHFGEKSRVVLTKELNNFIFSRGVNKVPSKVRVRVTKESDVNNAEENVFKTDLVVVGSFKGLREIVVDE